MTDSKKYRQHLRFLCQTYLRIALLRLHNGFPHDALRQLDRAEHYARKAGKQYANKQAGLIAAMRLAAQADAAAVDAKAIKGDKP